MSNYALPSFDSPLYLNRLEKVDRELGHHANSPYPFSEPMVQHFEALDFTTPITVICGENGCGKTTLMELLAGKLEAYRIGEARSNNAFSPMFLDAFKIELHKKSKRNFYFTGEDFIKYIEWIERTKKETLIQIDAITIELGDTYAAKLAKQPHQRTLYELSMLYGVNLSERSHGQGFIDFFKARLMPGGLYLMDEPESALSFENQYLLSLLIIEAVKKGCQFIISTHSPVLCAMPGATLYEISNGVIMNKPFEALENIQFLTVFMQKKEHFFD